MKALTPFLFITVLFGFCACQIADEVEEVFPGFIVEEGKLYEIDGKTPYTGELRDYFDDGTLKYEAYFEEGEQIRAIRYYENGNRKHKTMNTEEGFEMTSWYESGQKEEEFLPGSVRQWYENGQLRAEVMMDDNNNYHGDMRMWGEDGTLLEHEVYEHGELVEAFTTTE